MVSQIISHYRILKKLGAGGMGEVYLAEDTNLGRKVAIKLLHAELTKDSDRVRRFEQEARAASALNHPNILTVHEIGLHDGLPYIATEFIEGDTLRHRIDPSPMPLGAVLDVSIQLASALAAAHQVGIVHRDIKPDNIMLRTDGYVKLLDFGIAKLTEGLNKQQGGNYDATTVALVQTEPGTVIGTPNYMSPEQARGLEVDARTDIFSLGTIIYEMSTGHQAFYGATISDVVVSVLEKEPPPLGRYLPEAPTELQRIVSKALRKDKEERYQTIKDLLIDLKSLKRQLERQVEVKAELEHSLSPEITSPEAVRAGGKRPADSTALESRHTGGASSAHSTSSLEYIVGGIKRHRKSALLIAVALVIGAAAAIFSYLQRTQALTDRDTVLVADFVNTTGDAVFDGTLKQALIVQLSQSPFFNILSDERVRDALRYMDRSPDERVTKEVAREICQRQGIKAMLAGSISSLGSHYVITLEAINALTDEGINRQQEEAGSKEQVLHMLGQAASRLRAKLGESLSSIQKFDAPVEQATTSSLEALEAFSMGNELVQTGKELQAIPFYKRAIELDPNFALAYVRMAVIHSNNVHPALAAEYAQKAFDLRDRASEREKLYISSWYYDAVTGEDDKDIETLELFERTYPRDSIPPNNLCGDYWAIGQFEKALEQARESIRLDPNHATGYGILGQSFLFLNRFDEGRAVFERAVAQKLDPHWAHWGLYCVAFIQGDTATMKQQIGWAAGGPYEHEAADWQAQTAAFSGQWGKSREFTGRAIQLAQRDDSKEVAAGYAAREGEWSAAFGICQQARHDISSAFSLADSPTTLSRGAIGLALCGDNARAQSVADQLAARYPRNSAVNELLVPTIRATVEFNKGDAGQAIQLLRATSRYEMGAEFSRQWPTTIYIRGLAYLRQRAGLEAAAEFQKILDHRSINAISPLCALAHLGLARAAALTGDSAKSRRAYQDFLALWKDADPDIPIFQEAKQEYEKLSSSRRN